MKVNGVEVRTDDPMQPLADVLRANGFTGVKTGCRTGDCGTCTVLIDGQARMSCLTPAAHGQGRDITTVEGLGTPDDPHPLQRAFAEHHASQCGYCIPGFLVASVELVESDPPETVAAAAEALSGNLCRCTGYEGILDAVVEVAASGTGADRRADSRRTDHGTDRRAGSRRTDDGADRRAARGAGHEAETTVGEVGS